MRSSQPGPSISISTPDLPTGGTHGQHGRQCHGHAPGPQRRRLQRSHGPLHPRQRDTDINGLETATAIFAFDTINRHDLLNDCDTASHGAQQHPSSVAAVRGVLHAKTDNTAAVAAIARGRADNDTVRALARRLQSLQGLWKTAAESSHVPGTDNQPADHLSRDLLTEFLTCFPTDTVFRRLQTTGTLLASVYTTLCTSQ